MIFTEIIRRDATKTYRRFYFYCKYSFLNMVLFVRLLVRQIRSVETWNNKTSQMNRMCDLTSCTIDCGSWSFVYDVTRVKSPFIGTINLSDSVCLWQNQSQGTIEGAARLHFLLTQYKTVHEPSRWSCLKVISDIGLKVTSKNNCWSFSHGHFNDSRSNNERGISFQAE